MTIKAILACDDTGGVSKGGTLPWPNNSTDIKWFKENTVGHVVVMGSTTWEDPYMPRPLPNRVNVLVTSRPSHHNRANHYIDGDLTLSIPRIAEKYPGLITWVIGGPNIIEQTLGVIDEFYISRIPGDFDCDTHLPLKKIETLFNLTTVIYETGVTFEIWERESDE